MQADLIPSGPASDGSSQRQLGALIAEIEMLTQSELPPHEFQRAFLRHVIQAAAAEGGAVWQERDAGPILVAESDLPGFLAGSEEHQRWISEIDRSKKPQWFLPKSSTGDAGHGTIPAGGTLVGSPVIVAGRTVAIVELLLDHKTPPTAIRGVSDFLEDLCSLAAEFYRNEEMRGLRDAASWSTHLGQFTRTIHGSLELRRTAFAIANEGRRLIGCDRLSVLVHRNSRFVLTAVSGVDGVNRRADSARRMEQMATLVAAAGEPVWYSGRTDEMAPQIAKLVDNHLDDCHARWLAIIPLAETSHRGDLVGVLVAEDFTSLAEDTTGRRLVTIADHGRIALARALDHHSPPLMPLWLGLAQALGWLGWRRLPRTVLALFVVAAIAVGLIFIPAEYNVRARGKLQPVVRREVFAPADGVVTELCVKHGSLVTKTDLLARLSNAELDYERERVRGELETTRERLAAVEMLRISEPVEENQAIGQRAAETLELQARLVSFQQQQQILHARLEELEVRSPIGGQVVTWHLEDLLQARPIVQGQCLMRVVDVDGPWELELDLPEYRLDDVLTQQCANAGRVDVTFLLETDSTHVYRGQVERISLRARGDPQSLRTVPVVVLVHSDPTMPLRPDAGVVAKIHCGSRSLSYVWFHDIWEVLRRHLFF